MKCITVTVNILTADSFKKVEISDTDGHRWDYDDVSAAGCGKVLEEHLRQVYGLQ